MENWKLASPKLQLKTEFVRIKQLQLRFLCLLYVAEHLLGCEVEVSLATDTLREHMVSFKYISLKGHFKMPQKNQNLNRAWSNPGLRNLG